MLCNLQRCQTSCILISFEQLLLLDAHNNGERERRGDRESCVHSASLPDSVDLRKSTHLDNVNCKVMFHEIAPANKIVTDTGSFKLRELQTWDACQQEATQEAICSFRSEKLLFFIGECAQIKVLPSSFM